MNGVAGGFQRRIPRAIAVVGRAGVACVLASAAYLLLLAFPQPLFAHSMHGGGVTVHATQPLPDAMRATLARAEERLRRSPLYTPQDTTHVFICQEGALFGLFARQNYQVGGVSDWLVGQHVFLRESDLENDRLISPRGIPVPADRPLSYFIAHEAMHIAIVRRLGRPRYSQLPQWVDDGYADYVARTVDLEDALRKMKADERELDPRRSGLYIRYHLLVAYLLEQKGMSIDALLLNPPDRESVERELMARPSFALPPS